MLRKEIEEKFPFLSVVTYGGVEYVGIINNQDNLTTTMYIYTDLAEEDRSRFVELGEVWWWESNRMIPISIFMRDEMSKFRDIIMIMATKDVRVVIGPCTNLNSLAMKRTKRKSVQLVRKPK